jgi:MFS family permease
MVLLGLAIPAILVASFTVMLSYHTMQPAFLCISDQNGTQKWDKCTEEAACANRAHSKIDDSVSDLNWAIQFDLICSNKPSAQIPIFVYYFGCIVSTLFLCPYGDKWGRKSLILLMIGIYSLLSLKLVFVSAFTELLTLVALVGLVTGGFYNVAISYIIELVPSADRGMFAAVLFASSPIAGIIANFFSYWYNSWKIITTFTGILSLAPLFYISYMVDSPRLHYAKGHYSQARLLLGYMAKYNEHKKRIFNFKEESAASEVSEKYKILDKYRKSSAFNWGELLKYKSTKAITIVMSVCSFFVLFLYFGQVLNSEALILDEFKATLFTCFLDALAVLTAGILMTYYLPRGSIVKYFGYTGCVIAICISFFTQLPEDYRSAFLAIGRYISLVTFSTAYIYAIESFPTRIRCLGIGVASTFASFGKLCAYYISYLGSRFLFVYGIVGILILLSLNLVEPVEEMSGLSLHDDIQEIKKTDDKLGAMEMKENK